MNYTLSRSEQKRRAKNIERLAGELLTLSAADIARLPATGEVREAVSHALPLKGGARKRQLKFLAKLLRDSDCDALFHFLQRQKGSRLRENKTLHELERLRDDIINDALAAHTADEEVSSAEWPSPAIEAALLQFADLDPAELRRLAVRYIRSRKKAHGREIFRILRAAEERQRFLRQASGSGTK